MPVEAKANNDGFLEINRTWKNDDEINVSFPKTLYTESMPDNSKRIVVLYGPLVLAGQLGDTMPTRYMASRFYSLITQM